MEVHETEPYVLVFTKACKRHAWHLVLMVAVLFSPAVIGLANAFAFGRASDAADFCEDDLASFVQWNPLHFDSLRLVPEIGHRAHPSLAQDSALNQSFVQDDKAPEPVVVGLMPDVFPENRSMAWQYAQPIWHWHWGNRYRQPDWEIHDKHIGISKFFLSAEVESWSAFASILFLFLLVQYHIQDWTFKHNYHGRALLIWLLLAACCNMLVLCSGGKKQAVSWFSGYMLELIFSFENIFVFHIVVRAFKVPRRQAQRALMVVVLSQIMLEMVFFMGLAWAVRASNALPYILGAWLIYLGCQAGCEDAHHNIHFQDTWIYSICSCILGKRLITKYIKNDLSMIHFGDGGMQVSLLFVATISLVVVDFLLEVDVALTKIEELQNHFLAFTSSAAAAFVVPELFFLSRDLFARYHLLKFGICVVLVFFGIQMLAHQVVVIPTIVQVASVILALLICMVLSKLFPATKPNPYDDEEDLVEYSTAESEGESSLQCSSTRDSARSAAISGSLHHEE